MRTTTGSPGPLEDSHLPVQLKLAAAWTSFMFLYIYVDYFGLYKPGVIDDILAGIVWEFDISQTWATVALALMTVPILMIVMSMTLPARVSRATHLVVASTYIPVSVFTAMGEAWTYFYGLAVALEVSVLALIVRLAWNWPRTSEPSMPALAAPHRTQMQMRRKASIRTAGLIRDCEDLRTSTRST